MLIHTWHLVKGLYGLRFLQGYGYLIVSSNVEYFEAVVGPHSIINLRSDLHSFPSSTLCSDKLKVTNSEKIKLEILTIGIWNINQIIVETSRHIVNQIPDAQLYVYEEVPRILPQDPQMKMKMKALILEASIMATLKAKFQSRKIYSLKYNVVTTMFKLKVGEERVVIGEQIEDICKENELDISDEIWSNLKYTDSGVEREQMSEALLTSLAFRDSVQELTKIEEEKG